MRDTSVAESQLDSYGAGLQLRKSEQNSFHNNFLISQPNPMMLPSLKSSLRDDSNEWSHHRVWLSNKKVSILNTLNLDLICCPVNAVLSKAVVLNFYKDSPLLGSNEIRA